MDRIGVPSWIRDLGEGKIPFRQPKQPWYRRYTDELPLWVPAALATPLVIFLLVKGLEKLRTKNGTESL